MTSRQRRLTKGYSASITLREHLRDGSSLTPARNSRYGPFDTLGDRYPDWHPTPYSFQGMVRLVLYREVTGEGYHQLTQCLELADSFGLKRMPDESVLSRT